MTIDQISKVQIAQILKPHHLGADIYMSRVLMVHAGLAIFLAFFYDTWILALSVGALSLIAWFGTKALLPKHQLHRYVGSTFLGIYVALFIYQMHGLFEMHFFAFISAAILIIYQDWKLQIPLIAFILIHHASFAYAQFMGVPDVYFTQLQYMDLQTFIFHAILATAIVVICGKWSQTFRQNTLNDAIVKLHLRSSNKKMADINKALHAVKQELKKKNEELNQNNEELNAQNDELVETTRKQMEINARLAQTDIKSF
ncbi:hypothetical protein [Reichenbachiella ulvae]|uniref:Methyl-accepting chemotaxis protein n=1 Tax=Reichenbachiella ulvae TaxID=2980104 RepID=A0ABT3CQA8_9BACT|nr:hypothetical protein [Reichenbachiella ulvae]MCV9385699.1 hypothetical protein [Reichenbachiella ulvae]